MSYLDIYRNRILANGNQSSDGIINASKQTVKNNFSNSLFSEIVLIDNVEYEGIITQEKKSDDKKLLLLPDSNVEIGSVVDWKENHYLVMDFNGEGINEIYPTALLKLCNSTYPIKANKTRVLRGHDAFNRPVYEEVYAVDITTPCIVQMGTDGTNTDAQLVIPRNMMYLTLQYQKSDTLDYNYEFEMYNNKYKITDIDFTKIMNEKGIIKIIAERV